MNPRPIHETTKRPNNQPTGNHGQTIVALLAAIAILLFLYVFFLNRKVPQTGGDTGGAQTVYKAAINKASGVECQMNLRQVRSAIQMYEQTNESKPQSLQQLGSSGVTAAMLSCPVSKQAYMYNPQSGIVKCATHQTF